MSKRNRLNKFRVNTRIKVKSRKTVFIVKFEEHLNPERLNEIVAKFRERLSSKDPFSVLALPPTVSVQVIKL